MAKRSNYQDRVIRNYYRNRDSIMLERLGGLATELYLAEGKARAKLWTRAAAAMKALGIAPQRIQHLVQSDNPALVAKLVEELLAKKP